jgi:hypothetical protein
LSYVHEHNDSLPPNIQRRIQWDLVNTNGSWVRGNVQLDTTTSNIEAGVLYPHVLSASVYRCPADKSTVRDQPKLPRRRSYSLQMWLNSEAITGMSQDEIEESPFDLKKFSRIVDPPPSGAWVFIDEHELSIRHSQDAADAVPCGLGLPRRDADARAYQREQPPPNHGQVSSARPPPIAAPCPFSWNWWPMIAPAAV